MGLVLHRNVKGPIFRTSGVVEVFLQLLISKEHYRIRAYIDRDVVAIDVETSIFDVQRSGF